MATPHEKLREKIKTLKNFEAIEALDFIEYLEHKRNREINEAFENAPEVDETLTDEEVKAFKQADKEVENRETLSCDEFLDKYE